MAAWIGGFLHGSGQLLLHYPPLFELVDTWIAGLEWEDFEEVVAQLRRTFSGFSRYDRQRLMELVTTIEAEPPATDPLPTVKQPADPLLQQLLAWIA